MDEMTRTAFERLLAVARSDTWQSRRVVSFVLAWRNAESLGGFDLADLFGVDRALARDMATVFAYIATRNSAEYPERIGTISTTSSGCGGQRRGRRQASSPNPAPQPSQHDTLDSCTAEHGSPTPCAADR